MTSMGLLIYALNVRTTLTTYCLQIGHSANCFPQLVQVAMWPHSSITQSTAASQQILHKSVSSMVSFSEKELQTWIHVFSVSHNITTFLCLPLLFPQPFDNFHQFFFLDNSMEIDSVHGQKVLALFGWELAQILQTLYLIESNKALSAKKYHVGLIFFLTKTEGVWSLPWRAKRRDGLDAADKDP